MNGTARKERMSKVTTLLQANVIVYRVRGVIHIIPDAAFRRASRGWAASVGGRGRFGQ